MDEARSDLGLVGLFYLGRRDLKDVDRIGGFSGPFLAIASAGLMILGVRVVLIGVEIVSGSTARDLSPPEMAAWVAAFVIPLVLFIALTIRLGFCGVLIRDGQVEIRNPLRDSVHPVQQVVAFTHGGLAEAAELADGSRVRVWGIAMWFGVNRRPVVAGLAELNRRLADARAAAGH